MNRMPYSSPPPPAYSTCRFAVDWSPHRGVNTGLGEGAVGRCPRRCLNTGTGVRQVVLIGYLYSFSKQSQHTSHTITLHPALV